MTIMSRKKYLEAVKKCKLLVKQRQTSKYEIVKMAMAVCIIQEGNNGHMQTYSLAAFARDIGINSGTLSRWKREYVNVYAKIETGQKKDFKADRHAIDQVMRQVTANSTKREVKQLYKKYSKGYKSPEDKTLRCYTDRMKSMHFFICYSVRLKELDKEVLKEMLLYSSEIVACIKSKKSKKLRKPVKAIQKAKLELEKIAEFQNR